MFASMRHFRLVIMFGMLVCFFASLSLYAQESILLVSGIENTFGTSPGIPSCILWHLNESAGALEKVLEIDKQYGMRRISAFPEERRLVIWVYTSIGNTAASSTGAVVIVDVDNPVQFQELALPFPPTFSGYLAKSKSGDISVISRKRDEPSVVIHYPEVTGKTLLDVSYAEIPWNDVRLYGWNLIRQNSWTLPLSYKISDTGSLSGLFKGELKGTRYNPTIDVPQNAIRQLLPQIRSLMPVVNTDKVYLFFSGSAVDNRKLYWIYNKAKRQGHEFWYDGHYVIPQVFGEWLVFQLASPPTQKHSPIVNTGDFIFYDTRTGQQWENHLGDEVEILAIWEDKILYREGESLYKGSFSAGQIVAPRLILSDTIVQSVHWAFVKDNR